MPARSAFTRFAWAFVGYLIFVILFGAWVRITHSGAGCGSHWPTCHGEIIPIEPSIETMIEYTHRLTSGFLGLLGLGLVAWAARRFGAGRVTWAAVVTLVFIVFEALIGAGIVLAELVGDDDSVARAIVIALHLVNTLMLTGAAALTARWSSTTDAADGLESPHRGWLYGVLAALVVVSMTGAVTALGDTLFPVEPTDGSLFGHVADDLSATNHFLVRLRVIHPILSIVAAGLIYWVGGRVAREAAQSGAERVRRSARALQHTVAIQVVAGIVNIGLAAPGWMQLLHLLLAQVVWIAAVLTLDVCRRPTAAARLRDVA